MTGGFAGVVVQQPFVTRLAAEHFNASGVNVDEHILLERRNLPVSDEFGPSVIGSGGVGENLNNQLRLLDKQIGEQFEVLFLFGLAGPDGKPGTPDDLYRRRPGPLLTNGPALNPLIGFVANSPYALEATR